ncbi:uncharacterized protein LOC144706792 isoform X8 [Wolffia australiana]
MMSSKYCFTTPSPAFLSDFPAAGDRFCVARRSVDYCRHSISRFQANANILGTMKIIEANGGVLTNFEVLNFLRSRGATVDPMGCLGAVAASECKVFDYLIHTAACNQTRESVVEFMIQSEKFKLAKAEKLNLINMRPVNQAEAYSIIEESDKRLGESIEDLVKMISEVLPPPPQPPTAGAGKQDKAEEVRGRAEGWE